MGPPAKSESHPLPTAYWRLPTILLAHMTETANYRTEIVSRLRAVTDDLSWMVRGLTPSDQAYRQTDEEWSIHEHLSHLRDMEQEVFLPLLRWATVPDMLDPLDYSRREWHEKRYRPTEPASRVMEDIARIRDEELLIFRQMNDMIWSKSARLSRSTSAMSD